MDAVAAANHRSELVLLGPNGNDLAQHLDILDEHVGGLHHLHGEGGIDHVAAGEAVVQPPAGGRADVLSDVRRKGDDVVIERALNHDVIAFTTNVAENIGAPASRWLHYGLTSSDVVDTAFAVQMVQ